MNARMTAAAVSFALVSLGCAHVRPAAPVLPGTAASPPTPPDSVANATVGVDLTKLQGAIESAVPTVFATNNWSGQRCDRDSVAYVVKDNFRYRLRAARSPIAFSASGGALTATSTLTYHLDAQTLAGLWVGGHCVDASVVVSVTASAGLDASWTLQPLVTSSVKNGVKCDFQIIGKLVSFDASPIVLGQANALAAGLAEAITSALKGIPVKPHAEQLWNQLQAPVSLANQTWWTSHPSAVLFSGLQFPTSSRLAASVGIVGRPRFSAGKTPVVAPRALPDLQVAKGGGPSYLFVDGTLAYDWVSAEATKWLTGKRFVAESAGPWWTFRWLVGRKHLEIESVSVRGADDKAVVEITVTGSASGRLYLTGTPTYDPMKRELSVPDLEFDVATKNVLVEAAAWLAHDAIRDELRARTRWSTAAAFAQGRAALVELISGKDLGGGFFLSGEVPVLSVEGVMATQDGFVVRALATGTLQVSASPNSTAVPPTFWPL